MSRGRRPSASDGWNGCREAQPHTPKTDRTHKTESDARNRAHKTGRIKPDARNRTHEAGCMKHRPERRRIGFHAAAPTKWSESTNRPGPAAESGQKPVASGCCARFSDKRGGRGVAPSAETIKFAAGSRPGFSAKGSPACSPRPRGSRRPPGQPFTQIQRP